MTELRDSACHLCPIEAHRRCNRHIADGSDPHEGADVMVAIAPRLVPRLLQLGVAGSDGDVGDRCTSAKLQAAMLAQWPLRLSQLRAHGNDSDGGDHHGVATATAAIVLGTWRISEFFYARF